MYVKPMLRLCYLLLLAPLTAACLPACLQVGIFVADMHPGHYIDEGTYALLGAASFLGGAMRMTVRPRALTPGWGRGLLAGGGRACEDRRYGAVVAWGWLPGGHGDLGLGKRPVQGTCARLAC